MEEIASSGSAQHIASELKERVFDVGIDTVIMNLPGHVFTPGIIDEVGAAIRAVLPERHVGAWSRPRAAQT